MLILNANGRTDGNQDSMSWAALLPAKKTFLRNGKKSLLLLPSKHKRFCHSCSASDNFLKCQRNNWLVTFSKVYVYNKNQSHLNKSNVF